MLSFLIPLKLVQRYENKIDFSRKSVQKHIQIRYTPAISGVSLNKLIISETDDTILSIFDTIFSKHPDIYL